MNYKQTKRPMKKNIFILFITFQTYSFGQGEQPLRPDDFEPFRYEYTVEQLMEQQSAGMIKHENW
jgi:hypothetical protein